MNEKDWELLAALAEEKSLTRAAQRLYITQPAATRRIQQLETELGCPLLVRSRSGIELTTEGEETANYAAAQLLRLEELHRSLDNSGAEVRGTVRLACANAYARSCLPGLLKKFSALYSRVDLRVVTGHSSLTARRLISGEVQAAIVRGSFDWTDERLALGADPYYYVAHSEPVDLDRLPEMAQIRIATDAPLQAELDRWWTERYRCPPRVSTIVDRSDICIEMVRQGLGYSILSGLYLQSCPDLYRERIVFGGGRLLRRDTCAYCRASTLQIRAVRAFWEFLRASRDGGPSEAGE